MDDGDVAADVSADDALAIMTDIDFSYEEYRDRWCDMLDEVMEKAYNDFVKVSRGYYAGMPERFLEHTINTLKTITKCKVMAFEDDVVAIKIKNVEG